MKRCQPLAVVATIALLLGAARGDDEPTIPQPRQSLPERYSRPLSSAGPEAQSNARPSQKSPSEKPAPPGGEVIDLKPPPLEPGDMRFPINLGTALRLADARPLIVAAAQASAWSAEGQLQLAKVLWVPTLNFGFDYTRHDGYGPDFNRGINVPQGENALGQPAPSSFGHPLNQNVNYFYGSGGMTFTPPIPDYFINPEPGHALIPVPQQRFLTDMIFQPVVPTTATQFGALEHPTGQERCLVRDHPGLLQRPQVSRSVCRRSLYRCQRAQTGRDDRRFEQGSGSDGQD